jgi:rod shape determining protein RodA
MVKSALTQSGQRERYENKFADIEWGHVFLLMMLAGISVLILYSAAGMRWEPWAYKQLIFFVVSLGLMIGIAVLDLRFWLSLAYPIYGVALILLIITEFFGDVRMGAQRWIDLGIISFQASVFMKLAIVLGLARFYHDASARDAIFSWKLLIPTFMIVIPVLLVLRQPDLGTASIIAMTGISLMILAGLHHRVIIAGVMTVVVGAPLFFQYFMHEYQRKRVLTFLNPEADPSGDGYHILQSKIAMGSGGVLGKGLGLGSQSQLNFLPEKHTDFIMAAVGEELGFVGAVGVLVIFALIIVMSLRMAILSHSHFGRLAAAGVTATFSIYVLINGAMVMGLFPVVGVPMPILSYGGSAMLMIMIGFGIIQAVKVHRYQELPKGASIISRFE